MMRVKVVTRFPGHEKGDVAEIADEVANRWVEMGLAVVLPPSPDEGDAPEAAALAGPPETAVRPPARKR